MYKKEYMKNKKNELIRVQSVIERDRLNVGKDFKSLLIHDLEKVFKDYFDYKDDIDINLIKEGDKCMVSLNLYVSRIKNFNIVMDKN